MLCARLSKPWTSSPSRRHLGALNPNRLMAGKIIVYPACRELGLVPLENLTAEVPQVAALMADGLWNKQAEEALLQVCESS